MSRTRTPGALQEVGGTITTLTTFTARGGHHNRHTCAENRGFPPVCFRDQSPDPYGGDETVGEAATAMIIRAQAEGGSEQQGWFPDLHT